MTAPAVRPRDFVETGDGLYFAIVSPLLDDGCYLTSLRYHQHEGRLRKLDTDAAAALLHSAHPAWLAYSAQVDAVVHLVPRTDVVRVHRPDQRLAALLAQPPRASDAVLNRALLAARILVARGVPSGQLGLSGSLLLGAGRPDSDIDLVAYGRDAFTAARRALAAALADDALAPLGQEDWHTAWERRGSPIPFEAYRWHEERKGTKALADGTRLDLSLVANPAEQEPLPVGARKLGRAVITAEVTDATAAFDHPARYRVQHADVVEVLSFTPTYAGQAEVGETLEAAGWIEEYPGELRRLVVGTSREAGGEWIRTARPPRDRGI